MQNLVKAFKEYNSKHKKLVPFLIYFEIIAIVAASIFGYVRRNLKVVAILVLSVAAIVFSIVHLSATKKEADKASVNESVEIANEADTEKAEIVFSTDIAEEEIVESTEAAGKEIVVNADAEGTEIIDSIDVSGKDAIESTEGETSDVIDSIDVTGKDTAERTQTEEEELVENSDIEAKYTESSTDVEKSEIIESSDATKTENTTDIVSDTEEQIVTEQRKEVATGSDNLDETSSNPEANIAGFIGKYPETVAWIRFEDDRINYPVMQAGDNSKYSIKDFEGNDSETGALFLDYRSTADFSDPNSIIYGHNMRNRTMFGALKAYKDNLSFLRDHKYFWIITPEGKTRYMIFAFMDVKKDSYIYDVCGPSPSNMRDFLDTIEYKTYIDTGIEPTVEDKIITLSTCTKSDTLYFVMFAVKDN